MGALASVVVSSSCCAVSGSHPYSLPLAPPACRPGPVLLLPSGFGRCSATNGESSSHSNNRFIWLWDIIVSTNKTCQSNGDLFRAFFFPSSGQIWTEARSRGPQGGAGGRQVGINSSFSTWREGKKKLLTSFISSSLGLIKELEDNEWRDTIQLYKEEVRKN